MTETTELTTGTVVHLSAASGAAGTWLVVHAEAEQPGTVLIEKIFDGAGPTHLTATALAGDLSPVTTAQTDNPLGLLVGARQGHVYVPRHPQAYASLGEMRRTAEDLQSRAGIEGTVRMVECRDGQWTPVEGEETVPEELLGLVAHSHAYYDDGVTGVVGPCRRPTTCITSLHIAETHKRVAADAPRFGDLTRSLLEDHIVEGCPDICGGDVAVLADLDIATDEELFTHIAGMHEYHQQQAARAAR